MRPRLYSTYILTNTARTVLYVGVTGDLLARILRHRAGQGSAFCRRYRLWRLLHVEHFGEPRPAIEREKELKRYSRRRKERLIAAGNPAWEDLAESVLGLVPFVWGDPRADGIGRGAASP
jgi:putative endonuclease